MSKRRAYTIEHKVEIVKFAKTHSNRETGRKFKICESVVRKWKQQKAELQGLCEQSITSRKKFRLEGGGRKPCLSTIEDVLMEKIAQECEQQHRIRQAALVLHNPLSVFMRIVFEGAF